MRLIRLSTNPSSYLERFYNQHLELKKLPYVAQYQKLMADCFAWADFWTHAFKPLGYQVWEPVGNAELMQKTWAKENGVNYGEKTWLMDIVTAQVKHFQPDVVFVNDYKTYTADFFANLRSVCPSIKLVIGWCGAPFIDRTVFKQYDLVLSNIPNLVKQFQDLGHSCQYMRHAFDAKILDRIDLSREKNINFSFIGSIIKITNFHSQREKLLQQLVEKTDLELWSNVTKLSDKQRQKIVLRQRIYDLVNNSQSTPIARNLVKIIPKVKNYTLMETRPSLANYISPKITSRSNAALFGISMYQKLYQSWITFNNHIDISANYASNMRLYEATGIGTCLLTDWQPDLHEIFELDREVVSYRNADEAIDKYKYLIENKDECQKIAAAAQKRTLRDHTFKLRAQQLDRIIKRYFY